MALAVVPLGLDPHPGLIDRGRLRPTESAVVLLEHVGQLVFDQAGSPVSRGAEGALAKEHVLAACERGRTRRPVERPGRGIVVHPHGGRVAPGGMGGETAQRRRDGLGRCLAGGVQPRPELAEIDAVVPGTIRATRPVMSAADVIRRDTAALPAERCRPSSQWGVLRSAATGLSDRPLFAWFDNASLEKPIRGPPCPQP